MNDEYLWNKTGDDAEIERMETMLSTFRFDADSLRPLPLKQASKPENRGGWTLWLRIAFAGAAVASLVFAGWLSMPKTVTTARVVESESPVPFVGEPAVPPIETPPPSKIAPPPPLKIGQPFRRPVPTRKAATPAAWQSARRNTVLTTEEKYAYNQLMLALSITTAKLRIVSDTVNGNDEGGKDNR